MSWELERAGRAGLAWWGQGSETAATWIANGARQLAFLTGLTQPAQILTRGNAL